MKVLGVNEMLLNNVETCSCLLECIVSHIINLEVLK